MWDALKALFQLLKILFTWRRRHDDPQLLQPTHSLLALQLAMALHRAARRVPHMARVVLYKGTNGDKLQYTTLFEYAHGDEPFICPQLWVVTPMDGDLAQIAGRLFKHETLYLVAAQDLAPGSSFRARLLANQVYGTVKWPVLVSSDPRVVYWLSYHYHSPTGPLPLLNEESVDPWATDEAQAVMADCALEVGALLHAIQDDL